MTGRYARLRRAISNDQGHPKHARGVRTDPVATAPGSDPEKTFQSSLTYHHPKVLAASSCHGSLFNE